MTRDSLWYAGRRKDGTTTGIAHQAMFWSDAPPAPRCGAQAEIFEAGYRFPQDAGLRRCKRCQALVLKT